MTSFTCIDPCYGQDSITSFSFEDCGMDLQHSRDMAFVDSGALPSHSPFKLFSTDASQPSSATTSPVATCVSFDESAQVDQVPLKVWKPPALTPLGRNNSDSDIVSIVSTMNCGGARVDPDHTTPKKNLSTPNQNSSENGNGNGTTTTPLICKKLSHNNACTSSPISINPKLVSTPSSSAAATTITPKKSGPTLLDRYFKPSGTLKKNNNLVVSIDKRYENTTTAANTAVSQENNGDDVTQRQPQLSSESRKCVAARDDGDISVRDSVGDNVGGDTRGDTGGDTGGDVGDDVSGSAECDVGDTIETASSRCTASSEPDRKRLCAMKPPVSTPTKSGHKKSDGVTRTDFNLQQPKLRTARAQYDDIFNKRQALMTLVNHHRNVFEKCKREIEIERKQLHDSIQAVSKLTDLLQRDRERLDTERKYLENDRKHLEKDREHLEKDRRDLDQRRRRSDDKK